MKKSDVKLEIEQVRKDYSLELMEYSSKQDCSKDKGELSRGIGKLWQEYDEFRKMLRRTEMDCSNQKKALQTKVDHNTFDILHEKVFYNMVEKKDLEELHQEFLPVFQDFKDRLTGFQSHFDIQNQVLLNYDQVLSDKASKFNIEEIKHMFHMNYTKHKDFLSLMDKV